MVLYETERMNDTVACVGVGDRNATLLPCIQRKERDGYRCSQGTRRYDSGVCPVRAVCSLWTRELSIIALSARPIQNGFTDEAKAGEVRKTGFFRLLVHFNSGLQNSFTLQCLNLRKIDEAEADISRAKEALSKPKIVTSARQKKNLQDRQRLSVEEWKTP